MTQQASMGGDTAADFDITTTGRTEAPTPYVLADAAGPLSREELRSGRQMGWHRADSCVRFDPGRAGSSSEPGGRGQSGYLDQRSVFWP